MKQYKFTSGYSIDATVLPWDEQKLQFIKLKRLKHRFKLALFAHESVIRQCFKLYANKLINDINSKKSVPDFLRAIHSNQDDNAQTPALALKRVYDIYHSNTFTASYLLASDKRSKFQKIAKLYSELAWKFTSLKEFYNSIKNKSESLKNRFEDYVKQRDVCVHCNMRLAVSLERIIRSARYDRVRLAGYQDDLKNEAMCGLIIAVDNFDVSRGNLFTTFAVNWVRQSLKAVIPHFDTIRRPNYIHDLCLNIYKEPETASDEELAAKLDVQVKSIKRAKKSLNLRACCDIGGPVGEYLYKAEKNRTEHNVETEYVNKLLGCLNERYLKIVKLYFFGHEMTLEKVGEIMDITRERVRQIIAKSVNKMHHYAATNNPTIERKNARSKRRPPITN